VELPELPQGRGDPDVTIRMGNVCRMDTLASIADERAFPRNVGGFHIRFGHEIVVDLLPHADAGVVQTLLAGRFMGYLLRQRGFLPLHASAVAIDGKAVLFLGESGAGKSTTAAAFHSRGHDVLADDVAAVRSTESGVELSAAWPSLRLLEDSRDVIGTAARPTGFQFDKQIYRLRCPALSGPFPVKRIYFLDYESFDGVLPIRSSALSRLSSVALLNAHSLLRSWRAGDALRQINLDRSAGVASTTPVFRLTRPRSLNLLSLLVDFVEKDVRTDD
jgi:hypothetical protein